MAAILSFWEVSRIAKLRLLCQDDFLAMPNCRPFSPPVDVAFALTRLSVEIAKSDSEIFVSSRLIITQQMALQVAYHGWGWERLREKTAGIDMHDNDVDDSQCIRVQVSQM